MNSNKKKTIINILILLIILISIVVFIIPKKFDAEFNGIKYSLMDEAQVSEECNVRFEGTLSNTILFGKRFKGNIFINSILINQNNEDIKIAFNKHNKGKIEQTYYDSKKNVVNTISFGVIFTNKDFSKITITEFYNIKTLSYYKRPFEITAPANNQIQALEIYNELTQ